MPAYLLVLAGCLGSGPEDTDLERVWTDPGTSSSNPTIPTTDPTTSPPRVTEEFTQSAANQVDVLFAIDNSCSMSEEQSSLRASFPTFLDRLVESQLDYHIGVISMDMDDMSQSGRLREVAGARWIDNQTVDPDGVFRTMANLGTDGSFNERGRDAAHEALVGLAGGYNAGFLRASSSINVVVMSDENDHSTSIDNGNWIYYLQVEQVLRPEVSLTSIVGIQPGPAVIEIGTEYLDATVGVGGLMWDIGDSNYHVALEQIALDGSGLSFEFDLSMEPQPGTIAVEVVEDGVTTSFEEDTDWTYYGAPNSVAFEAFIPSPLSSIRISYVVDADG